LSLESRKSSALTDPGAELVDHITAAWQRYGRIALGAVGAIVVVAAVAYFTIRQNEAQDNAASQKLAQADVLYWQGDYDRAKTTAQEVARTFGSTPSGIDAHRIAGDAAFWRGNWKDAIGEYNAFLSKKGSGLVANSVRRSLAYAYDSNKQYAEAAKTYDQIVGVFERETSAEMLAASARCYEALGNKAEAVKRLQRVTGEFGETSFSARARLKLAELGATSN
jgi:tetratricopeptide (TPR) repeat protein